MHGADKIVKTLLENGAKAYTPDKKGLFPIDYAGLFKKDEVVKMLIDHQIKSIELIKNIKESYMNEKRNDYFVENRKAMDNIEENKELNNFWSRLTTQEEEWIAESTIFQPTDKSSILESIKGAKNKVNSAITGTGAAPKAKKKGPTLTIKE